ncbi:MAG: polyprenyl synthetase family protein [Marinifilaceae bacterium]|jgi:octaprenyl-diphosphate synthase|nr:polyprenyl synthetase family protein [Marinifilaceae bacterium]
MHSFKAAINQELKEFDKYFNSSLKSNIKLLDIINRYIIKRKGKELRPILVFLAAKLCGNVNQKTHVAASLMQLLHTATLLHDDVVDYSHKRRGFFSLNAIWRNKIAVLVGDFLLSKGLLAALETKNYDLLDIASNAVKMMSEGELLQIEKARKLDITEEVYYDIIYKKTASLIETCTCLGAISADANKEQVNALKNFGMNIGMAFQLKDDLFDFSLNNNTGKPAANDIKEHKLTLPIIHSLNNSSRKEKRWIMKIIKKKSSDKEQVLELINFVHEKGGIKYTEQKMESYYRNSINNLNIFEDSELKTAMVDLAKYIMKRDK